MADSVHQSWPLFVNCFGRTCQRLSVYPKPVSNAVQLYHLLFLDGVEEISILNSLGLWGTALVKSLYLRP